MTRARIEAINVLVCQVMEDDVLGVDVGDGWSIGIRCTSAWLVRRRMWYMNATLTFFMRTLPVNNLFQLVSSKSAGLKQSHIDCGRKKTEDKDRTKLATQI